MSIHTRTNWCVHGDRDRSLINSESCTMLI